MEDHHQVLCARDIVERTVDVSCCPDCGGTMKVIAALLDPVSIKKLLDALGLPSKAPPMRRRRSLVGCSRPGTGEICGVE